MARGLQRMVLEHDLRVVVVSCHRDFVAHGLLEPDWVFECHSNRLVRFMGRVETAAAPWTDRIAKAESEASQAAEILQKVDELLATPCFSVRFQTDVKILQPLRKRELEAKSEEVKKLKASREKAEAEATSALRRQKEQLVDESSSHVEADTSDDGTGSASPGVPTIHLEVRRCLQREWEHFKEHHYKDHKLKTDSVCFVGLLDGRAACFTAITMEPIHFVLRGHGIGHIPAYPSTWASSKPLRMLFREHRTVVHPDFQGMGLAPLLCDAVAQCYNDIGHDFTSQTVHPYYGSYREGSPFWTALSTNRKDNSCVNGNLKYSHCYIGCLLDDGSVDPEREQQLRIRVCSSAES